MSRYTIAVLPGDGIGQEVCREGVKVLEATHAAYPDLELRFTTYEASVSEYVRVGVALPDEVYSECEKADAIFLGAVGLPDVRLPDGTEVAGDIMFRLRFGLHLYAGVRPIRLFPGVTSPLVGYGENEIDYVIVRENIEGLYASRGAGTNVRDEVCTDTIVVTRNGTRDIVHYAFGLSKRRRGAPIDGRRRVTCVDKSNVLRSYAFFRKVYRDVAREYPEIDEDYAYIDAMTLWQIQRPEYYDVVVTENMFGDIISDLAAGTVGGLGMAPSGDIGDAHGLFQPSHGSAPAIAGKGVANPIAAILSGSLMLDWIGTRNDDDTAVQAARAIEEAVARVLATDRIATEDLGGNARTWEVGDAVARRVVADER